MLFFSPALDTCGGKCGDCTRRNKIFSTSLRTLNVGRFEAARFAYNKGFILEITAAGKPGDFENTEVCVEQNKLLGAIITHLDK